MQFRLVAVIAVLLSQLLAHRVVAGEILLRISLQQPVNSPIGQSLLGFKSEVEEKTGGVVKVNVYDKAQFYLRFERTG